jgi:hypothetical protein
MIEAATEDNWDVPLVDYYLMDTPDGTWPTRQANGIMVSVINCREDEGRKVLAIMLYSTEVQAGMLMPLSPETIRELADVLASKELP